MVKVLQPGFYSTIQDLGRSNFQLLGVPLSGVMDEVAAKMANAIVGNDAHCAVLEMTMLGPKMEFCCDTVIAITGADLSAKLNGSEIRDYSVITIKQGDVLSFGKLKTAFRTYLAVSGGFLTDKVLDSRSMYYGITKTSHLKKGDVLEIHPKKHSNNTYSSIKANVDYLDCQMLSVYKGPEFESLKEAQMVALFNNEFTISKENNRMAYQLEELIANDLTGIITSLVLPGTIQLTPSGKLIVLMRDCQTTGGYPRVLQLSEASINVLAQKKVGDKISFKLLDYTL